MSTPSRDGRERDATMAETAGFHVLYQFRLRAGMEDAFQDGWRRLTLAIREQRGGLGSRLHRAADGWWVAYAQWPDRATWERSQQADAPVDDDAQALMASAIVERRPPLPLEPVIDLLVPTAPDGGGR